MKDEARVNNFVVRFANVNGSGSASANGLFAKALFRLGLSVSPKNIFPSNIQGLPTWYEVRINDQGYLARRGDVDLMVAVNGQTLRQDYDNLAAGGFFLYDSSKQLPEGFSREDITLLPIPLTLLTNEAFPSSPQRPLLKNIVYVGALAGLLDMGLEVFRELIGQQFQKKPALAEPNLKALELGYEHAQNQLADHCALSVQSVAATTKDLILMDGNSAAALGAIYAGATVVGWYPITPSTSVIEAFGRYARQFRLEADGRIKAAIVQAEDELAAIGMVIGASWNGARAFTATSGPGISLMSEFLGLAYFAEIPAVIINVQRTGPSTGMPTRTQQSDILACAHASHGDTKHPLLFPATPTECFTLMASAFDLAEGLQTPVMVMSDLDLGMNEHICPALQWEEGRSYKRGKVLNAAQLDGLTSQWGRYLDIDGDGVCYRTFPGAHPSKGVYFTRGTSRNEYSGYTEDNLTYEKNMRRLLLKWESAKQLMPAPELRKHPEASKLGAMFYGSSSAASQEALERLAQEHGLFINAMRLLAYPFSQQVTDFLTEHELIFVIEQNRDGQMRLLLSDECVVDPAKLVSIAIFDGLPIASRSVYDALVKALTQRGALRIEANSAPGDIL